MVSDWKKVDRTDFRVLGEEVYEQEYVPKIYWN